MKINQTPVLPPNGNPGIVPPWLQVPRPPAPPTPPAQGEPVIVLPVEPS